MLKETLAAILDGRQRSVERTADYTETEYYGLFAVVGLVESRAASMWSWQGHQPCNPHRTAATETAVEGAGQPIPDRQGSRLLGPAIASLHP